MFYENDESRLYRKFLNNWSKYWHKKREKMTVKIDEKLRNHNKVFFAKTGKYVVSNADTEDEDDDDDLLAAVRRLKERRKSQSLGKWEKLGQS